MKKIGILTFHKAINYGSVLQAYALQSLLTERGYDVEIIDYEPQKLSEIYSVFIKKSIVSNLKRLPIAWFYQKKKVLFSKFRTSKLHLSAKKYFYHSSFEELADLYDCIICGSDQIWNVAIKDCDPIFFLPGVNTKKITYAVSVGNTDFVQVPDADCYLPWIRDFAHITVREKKTEDKLKMFLQTDESFACTLDPTMLHPMEKYETIASPRIIKDDYIFIYNIWNGADGFEIASRISEKMNLPVYTMLTVKNISMVVQIKRKGIHVDMIHTAPQDYLSFIKNASFVITDSFHGTAFSIIFEKKFVCVNYKKANGEWKNDIRLNNILSIFGLEHRYVTREGIDLLDIHEQLDYEQITAKRMELAQNSIDVLLKDVES